MTPQNPGGNAFPEAVSVFTAAPCPVCRRLFELPFQFLFVWGVLSPPNFVFSCAFQVFCVDPMAGLDFSKLLYASR